MHHSFVYCVHDKFCEQEIGEPTVTVIVIAAEIVLLRLVDRTSVSAFKECQVRVGLPRYSPINNSQYMFEYFEETSLPLPGHEGACISAAFQEATLPLH